MTRAQLLELGLTEGGIDRRLRNGTFARRYPGVYCQVPARHDAQAWIAAAVLAGGPTAAASHASAGWLWGYVKHWQPPAEISLPTGDRRPRHILTHRCPSLKPRDVTHQLGVPATSPARTALDIAPRLTAKQLTRLVNDQLRADGYLHREALADVVHRNPRHPGAKLLRPFIDDPRNPTDSPLEDEFLAFIKRYDLPMPQTNLRLHGRKVDVCYPEANLIVELDGWDFHDDKAAFEDDRDRDAEQLKHGLTTIRITTARLAVSGEYEAERLMTIYRREVARKAQSA